MSESAEVWRRCVVALVRDSREASPSDLADLASEVVRPLGVGVWIYLVDREQETLRPLARSDEASPEPLDVDTTVPGRAYMSVGPVSSPGRPDLLWMPMLDDSERYGVVEFRLPEGTTADDPVVRDGAELIATTLGRLVVSKSNYGDTLRRGRRSRPMSTEGEMLWRSLPPLTCVTGNAALAAALEPCYDVGGDAFDYAFDYENVRIGVFDAQGHGLDAALTSTLTLAATRAARAAGLDLPATAAAADQAISSQFGEMRYTTAVLAELDVSTGVVRYVNAGHPPAVLIREGKVVKSFDAPPRTPLGIPQPATVSDQDLQPRDRLLFYTDGVTDARDAGGGFLGLDRLVEIAERSSASGLPVAEVCRRLAKAVVDYQHGRLADDATLVLVEWLPEAGNLP